MIKMIARILERLTAVERKPVKTEVKVVDCGALPNNGTKTVPHGLTAAQYSHVIRFWGIGENPSSNRRLLLPYVSYSTNQNHIGVLLDATNIRIDTMSDRRDVAASKVYIEYEV